MKAKSMNKVSEKVYRLGLYGRSNSGKTCILAALSMPRTPHPKGYTCTWRPVDAPAPKTSEGKHDEWLLSLHRGKRMMEEAVARLAQKDVPPPTPIGGEQLIFEYDFTIPDHQHF